MRVTVQAIDIEYYKIRYFALLIRDDRLQYLN